MYKLRDTNSSKFGEGFETYYDPKRNTELQVTFESYLSVAAMLPNILFMFINTAATKLYVNFCVKSHHFADNCKLIFNSIQFWLQFFVYISK